MKKLKLIIMQLAIVAAAAVGFFSQEMTCKAAFDAPYYNITTNGGTFDGEHYYLADGTMVKNAFFCDGTYTYFLQADGTPMKNRLTYHPDGVQIIYFDSQGHECFDTFANVKRSIAGDEVDDLCYFGTTGNMYVNVLTYNVEGTKIYYANPYGVMERYGVFKLDTNAVNYEALASGKLYGYALSDGTVTGFYDSEVEAAYSSFSATNTNIQLSVIAAGKYINWDGTTNVSQFRDNTGNFCFAYDSGSSVVVVKPYDGNRNITLTKVSDIFGAVTCDSDGYYYVVTGKNNETDDTAQNTIFITKYDSNGNMIASRGDNGSSSLAYYYSESFYTKYPFNAGNCDIAVNGDYVAVNYARKMYSGHQSNSMFVVNRKTMETVNIQSYYNSHSFAQRVVPYNDKFILASEGDCYDRAFTVSVADPSKTLESNWDSNCTDWNIFNFWVAEGTYDKYDMWTLNNNFAHMGGLAAGSNNRVAFVSTSVKSMNSNALNENEQLFIQIFVPNEDGTISFITQGTREGLSGPNGTTPKTDEGVKWLTDYSSEYTIQNSQIVYDSSGKYYVLFELSQNGKYLGVYYTVLDENGTTLSGINLLSSVAYLNPAEMPVYANGSIYWVENNASDSSLYENNLYIYRFQCSK